MTAQNTLIIDDSLSHANFIILQKSLYFLNASAIQRSRRALLLSMTAKREWRGGGLSDPQKLARDGLREKSSASRPPVSSAGSPRMGQGPDSSPTPARPSQHVHLRPQKAWTGLPRLRGTVLGCSQRGRLCQEGGRTALLPGLDDFLETLGCSGVTCTCSIL